MNEESKSKTEQLQEEQYHEVNEKKGNPVVEAQKQISSQRTVGVYSPEQEQNHESTW